MAVVNGGSGVMRRDGLQYIGLVHTQDEGMGYEDREGLVHTQGEGMGYEDREGLVHTQDEGMGYEDREGLVHTQDEGMGYEDREGLVHTQDEGMGDEDREVSIHADRTDRHYSLDLTCITSSAIYIFYIYHLSLDVTPLGHQAA
ncbi:hypothetical protein J4Q44_G00077150 [Coregonus suidteri]|uniref:Uncharacterized protein n=1 Tax=Coregonus suidteri TaxID=861788 RepID=A0AAN8R479_9TELE